MDPYPDHSVESLYRVKPDGVLRDAAALEEYEHVRAPVLSSLIELNTNTYIIPLLNERPRFGARDVQPLFNYLAYNLFRYSLVIAHRVWSDQGPDTMTLKRLRTVLIRGARDEWQPALRARLRENGVGEEVQGILDRISSARHRALAHQVDPRAFDPTHPGGSVDLADLQRVGKALGEFYNALIVGTQQTFVLTDFFDGGGLKWLRNLLAAHTNESRSYDEHEEWWRARIRPKLSDEDLAELNRARLAVRMRPIQPDP